MKVSPCNYKSIIKSLSPCTIMFTLCLSSFSIHAVETDLDKTCARQAILIAAELKNHSAHELTERDVDMIRLGAINACRETYRRTVNTPDAADTNKKVVAKEDVIESQSADSGKKESIFDRLLSSDKKEDVSPMQKQHRTGGK